MRSVGTCRLDCWLSFRSIELWLMLAWGAVGDGLGSNACVKELYSLVRLQMGCGSEVVMGSRVAQQAPSSLNHAGRDSLMLGCGPRQ